MLWVEIFCEFDVFTGRFFWELPVKKTLNLGGNKLIHKGKILRVYVFIVCNVRLTQFN